MYVNCYLEMHHYTRENTAVRLGIRNYLQEGKGQQSINAKALEAQLTAAINRTLNRSGALPATFDIFQYVYVSTNLRRVFMGKGAPDEIQDCLWLMDQLGIVDGLTVNTVCDKHLGIDCGGFVANYWGKGRPDAGNMQPTGWAGFKPRYFWETNAVHRRRHKDQVELGDAAVFFTHVKNNDPSLKATDLGGGKFDTSTGSKAEHIALVDDLVPIGYDTARAWLGISESSGAMRDSGYNGVNSRVGTYLLKQANDLVYCESEETGTRIYFVGPGGPIQPYLPWGYGSE
jgi:hypothetical protein